MEAPQGLYYSGKTENLMDNGPREDGEFHTRHLSTV